MNVLAVDTCLQPGSVALLRADDSFPADRKGAELEVVPLPPGWRSVALHAEIERLLARHNLSTADIHVYAVTVGPGAFTGVRLGLTAVKGLAEVHNKPVVPVSTLEALAAAAAHQSRDREGAGTHHPERHIDVVPLTALASVLDARRGQVFGAVYGPVCQAEKTERIEGTEGTENTERSEPAEQAEGTEFRLGIPETVGSLRSFLDQIEAAGLTEVRFCVADEALLLELQVMEGTARSIGSLVRVSPYLAGTVARMAAARFRQGRSVAALVADANYVRASDAELFWKE